jgi:chaperonin GroEL
MITDHTQLRTDFENPAILISDLEIEVSREMLPIVEMATKNGIRSLVVVVRRLSEQAIATFLLANKYPENFRVMAVKTPGLNAEDRGAALEDLAVLTGGTPLIDAAGHTFRRVKPEMLGRARRAWATPNSFGVVGGNGDARLLRQHISSLRARYQREENLDSRRKVQQRIGKLMGGSASLWIGGATEIEITMRKELAQRVADTLRGAVMEGVLPGGGVSLLACQPALERKLVQTTDPDERAAYRILIKALAVPTRTIITNAGYDDSEILARICLAGEGCGFDVVSGRLVDMTQAGIFDAITVQRKALQSAVVTAALALTIDVLVHHQKPEQVQSPG